MRHSNDLWTSYPRSKDLRVAWGVFVCAEYCSVSGNSFNNNTQKKPRRCFELSGDISHLHLQGSWVYDEIRADFWMCGLVVFKVFHEAWRMISAASQYEIWILVSSTSWDQRDNWNMLCNNVITVNAVTCSMKTPHAGTDAHASLLGLFSPYLLGESYPFSSVAIAMRQFDWHTCPSTWQRTGLGCRRSSSDAAYELAETVRAQRECRLRPHYSDPMPADASKRKQLEMKIAAAARLHSHRRDRDHNRDRDSGESRPFVLEWLQFRNFRANYYKTKAAM